MHKHCRSHVEGMIVLPSHNAHPAAVAAMHCPVEVSRSHRSQLQRAEGGLIIHAPPHTRVAAGTASLAGMQVHTLQPRFCLHMLYM